MNDPISPSADCRPFPGARIETPKTELSAADTSADVTAETRETPAPQHGEAGLVEAALIYAEGEWDRIGEIGFALEREGYARSEIAMGILAAEVRRLQEFKDHYTELAKANGFGSITEAVTAGRLYFQSQAERKR